ncbi:hypothetical protein B0T14DRAFT_307287 [Immersiella caudata]|uniref:Uncharacterized protein n=1 Tax=Immersiella caudata TaxID=314043 RepID=A0AA40BUN6_9PEZI|nr:hypothetical protein B0T14DRAFT_307287 [Immersiella caudata]
MDDADVHSISRASTIVDVSSPHGTDIIELKLTSSGSWTERRVIDIPEPDTSSPAVIYLFEGVDYRTRKLASSIVSDRDGNGNDGFLRHHEGKAILSASEKAVLDFQIEEYEEDTSIGLFLASWFTLATQDKSIWEIERRIESGKAWCSSEQRDPAELRLDHSRYRHFSSPYRLYHPLEEAGGTVRHAARECVSMSFGKRLGSLVGIVVFDPPRKLVKMAVKYDLGNAGDCIEWEEAITDVFPEELAARDVFLRQFRCISGVRGEEKGGLDARNVFQKSQSIVRRCAFEAESKILKVLTQALDDVEVSLSKDEVVREALDVWMGYFGRWRNTLFHQEGSLKHLRRTTRWAERLVPMSADERSLKFHARVLDAVIEENAAMLRRLDSVYHAVMSTMQIAESKRAIEEAELVSKLTHLAFFFIPLTLVTGIFGMDMIVSLTPPRTLRHC